MFRKLKENKKGFTLAELLIVVAIIAVLVAISIPIFTSRLEKARESTDIANMRAAKAAAVAAYLSDDTTLGLGSAQTKEVTLAYDATAGKLVTGTTAVYGKGTAADGKTTYDTYDATKDYTAAYIQVVVGSDGTVTLSWPGAK